SPDLPGRNRRRYQMTYRVTCSCGHITYQGADTREEAIQKFQDRMTQGILDAHFDKHHQGQQKPSLEQAKSMLVQNMVPAVEAWGITLPPVIETATATA